jgi:hypothetical protein
MRRWLNDLDRILRGEATALASLRDEKIEIPLGGLSLLILLLAMSYGLCMGSFAGFRVGGPFAMQWFASIVKVPMLFFLTLAVTLPSLYVFNALVGSRLNLLAVLQLLVASLAVNVAVLASAGPIVAFFSISTTSYSFALLLNVLVFTVSGILGLAFLLQTLHRLSVVRQMLSPILPHPEEPQRKIAAEREQLQGEREERATPIEAELVKEPSALEQLQGHTLGRHVKTVFICWMVIFGLVGSQMAWVLRPFVGNPSQPFQWFRVRESNFFEAVWQTFQGLFS